METTPLTEVMEMILFQVGSEKILYLVVMVRILSQEEPEMIQLTEVPEMTLTSGTLVTVWIQ